MGLKTVIRGGVGKLVNKGYSLDLGHHSESFADAEAFSAFLKARIGVPAEAMMHLRELPEKRLERELAQTEAVYKMMLQGLLQVAENDAPVEVLWRDLDISVLPDEQHWPSILFAVSSSEGLTTEMKLETVQRFVEFLRARKTLLQRIRAARLEDTASSNEFSDTAEIPVGEKHPAEGGRPVGNWPIDNKEDDVTIASRTVSRNYRRLERGANVEVRLDDGETLPMYLSRWKIELKYSSGTLMLEEEGNRIALPRGQHFAGRSSSCEAALSGAPLDVSRKHLKIENVGDGRVVVEDLSSKGTWMPEEFLLRAAS